MANISFPAQVAAVFDTDGKIHPKWLRFRNSLGEIVFLNNLTIEQEGSDAMLYTKTSYALLICMDASRHSVCVTV